MFGSKTPKGGRASGEGLAVSVDNSVRRAVLVRNDRLVEKAKLSFLIEQRKQVRMGSIN